MVGRVQGSGRGRPGTGGQGGLLLLILLSAALVGAATVRLPRSGKVVVGGKAPSLASWDLDDKVVTLSKVLGRPGTRAVLVSFFASWCKECRPGLKRLQANRDRLARAGIEVLLVNCGEEAEAISRFMKEQELTLRVATDEFAELRNAYGVRALPRAFLVGGDQRIRAIYIYEGEDFIDCVLKDAAR